MRCPTCQYALWNLPTPTCPECGRGFTLDRWDFAHPDAPKDIRFACNACGAVLPGRLPGDLPLDCPACRAPIDRQGAMVVPPGPGGRGAGVPAKTAMGRTASACRCLGLAVARFVRVLCTIACAVSAVSGLVVMVWSLGLSFRALHRANVFLPFILLGIASGVLAVWPRRTPVRWALVAGLLVAMLGATLTIGTIKARGFHKSQMFHRAMQAPRSIAQGVLIYTQDQGAFPQDPGALVGQGVVPIEVFFLGQHPPATLSWHSLADGWIMAGSFAIDWNQASWRADPPVVTIIAHPPARLARTPIGSGDATVELLQATAPQSIQQWNADRAAQGLSPIPAAALPANRTP